MILLEDGSKDLLKFTGNWLVVACFVLGAMQMLIWIVMGIIKLIKWL